MHRQSGRTTKQRRASLRKAIGEVSRVNRALNYFVSCSKEGGGVVGVAAALNFQCGCVFAGK